MSSAVNRQWRLVRRPSGPLDASNFEWVAGPVPAPGDGEVLVRTLQLSLDPTYRSWAAGETYVPAVPIGAVMRGIGVGVVDASRSPAFAPGDLVQGMLGWQEWSVQPARAVSNVVLPPGMPLYAALGLFGHIGATAYFGLVDVARPKAGETLVVTGAAGAVGSLVGQIGRILGLRVVGIAGSDEKCAWLTNELGFDGAVNYRTEPVRSRLAALCPDGIDVHFENVGGELLEIALSMITLRARVVLCGLIAQYNDRIPPPGPRTLGNLLIKRARMEGFIVLDYANRFAEAAQALAAWYAEGRLRYRVDIVRGLELAPSALSRLFDGTNQGKLIVEVAESS